MALALHRITGMPMALWGAEFNDDLSDTGKSFEYAHSCIDLGQGYWMDVNGIQSNVPENMYFYNKVGPAFLLPATAGDVSCAFSVGVEEEDIQHAIAFATEYPPLQASLDFIDKALKKPKEATTRHGADKKANLKKSASMD